MVCIFWTLLHYKWNQCYRLLVYETTNCCLHWMFLAPIDFAGGYHIPKGTTVMINTYSMHYDPQEWDQPDKFLPGKHEFYNVPHPGISLTWWVHRRIALKRAITKAFRLALIRVGCGCDIPKGTSDDQNLLHTLWSSRMGSTWWVTSRLEINSMMTLPEYLNLYELSLGE